jgi:hypothetical protein
MGTVLGYAWRIATNVFYLAVVFYVLEQLHQRPETIIVPVLGLIYLRVHMIGIALGTGHMVVFRFLNDINDRLKLLIDPHYQRDTELAAEIEKTTTPSGKDVVDYIFISLVSLLCLWKLFVSL